ncbi:MAG: hypothetical protein ACTSUN_00920 [Promethearchaeota archaeon]
MYNSFFPAHEWDINGDRLLGEYTDDRIELSDLTSPDLHIEHLP